MASGNRGMNPVPMTIINPRKEIVQAVNRSSDLKFCVLLEQDLENTLTVRRKPDAGFQQLYLDLLFKGGPSDLGTKILQKY